MKNKKVLLVNILLLLALLLFILLPYIANELFRLGGSISGDISLLLSGGTSVIVLGGIALLYCIITKRAFNKVMVIKKISIKQFFLTISVALGTYVFAVGINSISMKLFPVAIKDGMAITKLLSSSSLFLGLMVVVLIPAFFEEVFFRGIFLDAYEGLNKKMKYFIITAIFATFHGNVMQIIYVMFLGFILLKVREYTGSLVGSMILHAANNAISFIISKATMNYTNIVNNGTKDGIINPAQAAATADAMNASILVVLLRASILFLIGGTILYINLRKLKEYKREKDGLELINDNSTVRSEVINYNSAMVDGSILHTSKKIYIPLIIYFVFMTALVVLKY